jgi:hypothetical protein
VTLVHWPPNSAFHGSAGQRDWPVPSSLRSSAPAERGRYAALGPGASSVSGGSNSAGCSRFLRPREPISAGRSN